MTTVFTSHKKAFQYLPAVLLLLWVEMLCAQTFTVNTTADTIDNAPGNGVCADKNTKCSLRAAIMEANAQLSSSDTIKLSSNTYILSINNSGGGINDKEGDLDITDDLTLQGQGTGKTFIDGNKLDRVFHISNGATTFTNLTIRNGNSSSNGGGVEVSGNSTGIFDNVTISGNKAANGGGIDIASGSIVTIKNSTLSDNSGFYAGGIQVESGGELRLENSTLTQNRAGGGGGGIFLANSYAIATITNSTISGNTAGTGAGIYNISKYLNISNTTITNNQSRGSGGGYFTIGPKMLIKNSIIAGNTAKNGPDCNGSPAISLGYNLIGNNSWCSINYVTGDLVGDATNPIDPMINSLSDNGGATQTHALLPNSIAIDAGNPLTPGSGGNACALSDQRDSSRIDRGLCDIGSFEASGGGDAWVSVINEPDIEPSRKLIQQIITVGNKGPNKVSSLNLDIALPFGSQNITLNSNVWSCTTNSNISSCTNASMNAQTETTLALNFTPTTTDKSLITQAGITTVSADPITTNNQVAFETILNIAPIVITQSTISYEKGTTLVSVSPTANIIDEDDTTLTDATIQITGGYRPGEDELYWSGNAKIIAQWIPDTATLTLTGNDTIDNYKQALREIIYDNRTETPTDTGQRNISITVSDAYDSSKPEFVTLEIALSDGSADSTSEDTNDNTSDGLFETEDSFTANTNPETQAIEKTSSTQILSDKRLWEHDYEKGKEKNEEDDNIFNKALSWNVINTIKYDDKWVDAAQIELNQKTPLNGIVIAGAVSIFLAGLAHFYLRALSLLGLFFSSPLLLPFDPLPILMISKKEKKKRKIISKKEIAIENKNKKIGALLDDNPSDNKS